MVPNTFPNMSKKNSENMNKEDEDVENNDILNDNIIFKGYLKTISLDCEVIVWKLIDYVVEV